MKSAVVLLSGGLDSATVLHMAQAAGRLCHTLTVDYGQRHRPELHAARALAVEARVESHREVRVDLSAIGGSALTDPAIPVPEARSVADIGAGDPPITYVPARNTILLSVALGLAETLCASEIWCGVNAVDFSGYPDCRPEFIQAFEALARVGTRAGVEGRPVKLKTPLVDLRKAEIIRAGTKLGVDYARTTSCYQPNSKGLACGACEACLLRRRGFEEAGLPDPTRYRRPPRTHG